MGIIDSIQFGKQIDSAERIESNSSRVGYISPSGANRAVPRYVKCKKFVDILVHIFT